MDQVQIVGGSFGLQLCRKNTTSSSDYPALGRTVNAIETGLDCPRINIITPIALNQNKIQVKKVLLILPCSACKTQPKSRKAPKFTLHEDDVSTHTYHRHAATTI